MNKYDQAETHMKWINSAEYAQAQEDDKTSESNKIKEA